MKYIGNIIKAIGLGMRPLPPLRICKHEPRCVDIHEHRTRRAAEPNGNDSKEVK